jgi:hypothetical protein
MADNFVANAGSGGSTFASDEISTTHYPRVKISVGGDGVAQDGWTPLNPALISAASTNGTVVKASPGTLGFIYAVNLNAAVRYLKLYNSTTVTVGTTTQLAALPIPASTTGAGFMLPIPGGLFFSTGICIGLTTGSASSDTGSVAAGEIFVWLGYA